MDVALVAALGLLTPRPRRVRMSRGTNPNANTFFTERSGFTLSQAGKIGGGRQKTTVDLRAYE